MLRYLLTVTVLVLALPALGKDIPNSPHTTEKLTKIILGHWVEWCMEFDKELNEGVELEGYSFEANLDENTYQLQLTPEGKMGTVLIANFSCTNKSVGLCGSGGCHQYIMADGKIFERHGHRPYSVTDQNQTFIILPKHGLNCSLSNNGQVYGADACYHIAIWDEAHSAFRSMGNQLPLSELSPE